MRYTIDTIEKLIETADRERTSKEAEIASLTERIRETEAAAEKEVAADNIEKYKEHLREKEFFEAKRSLAKKQLEQIHAEYTSENVKAAWADYTADYGKIFDKKMSEYQKARKALYSSFMELVDLQNEGLKNREKCGRLIGKEEPEINLSNDYNSVYPEFRLPLLDTTRTGKTNNWRVQSPDAVFFLESGIASDAEMDKYNSVLRLHHSC